MNDVLEPIGVSKSYPCNAIIRDLSTATNEWAKHDRKCQYLQFIALHFSERECKAFGIKCSPTSLRTARDCYNNFHGAKVYQFDQKLGGTFNEVEHLKENGGAIKAFVYDKSQVAANRFSEKQEENMG